MARLMFHVRHEAKPEYVFDVMSILRAEEGISLTDMLSRAKERGIGLGQSILSLQSLTENPVQTARDVGLIKSDKLSLTPLGATVCDLLATHYGLAVNLCHFLFYVTWDARNYPEHCFSWTYRHYVDHYWSKGTAAIDRGMDVSYLESYAKLYFGQRFQEALTKVSLSTDSVTGILNWLRILDPPCIEESNGRLTFRHRSFCPPELMLLALDFLYREAGAEYGVNLALDEARIEALCKVCVLDPIAFEGVLDWTLGQFDFVVHGAGGGLQRFVCLYRRPEVEDFLR